MAIETVEIRLVQGNKRVTPWGYTFLARKPVVTTDNRLIQYARSNPGFRVLDRSAIRDEETQRARRTAMSRRRGNLDPGDAMPAPRPEPMDEPPVKPPPKKKATSKKALAKKKAKGGGSTKKKAAADGKKTPARKKA